MTDGLSAFLFTIGGAAVGSITSIVIAVITSRAANRRHMQELVVRAATENWKGAVDVLKLNGGSVAPFDIYLVNALALFSRIDFAKISPDDVTRILDEVSKIRDRAIEWVEKDSESDNGDRSGSNQRASQDWVPAGAVRDKESQ